VKQKKSSSQYFFYKLACLVCALTFYYSHTYAGNHAQLANEVKEQIKDNEVANGFTENKGQLIDDQGNLIQQVFFKNSKPGMDLYITDKGLTYVFMKAIEKEETEVESLISSTIGKEKKYSWSRVDVSLAGSDIQLSNVVKEEQVDDGEVNYFLGHCPQGIIGVKTYKKVTIKNIYPNIDWEFICDGDNNIKHNFILHPGANPSLIKMNYDGATGLESLKESNSVKITTENGVLQEGALYSYQGGYQNKIHSEYIVKNKEVSFQLEDYNTSEEVVIDPPLQLKWSTCYGGSGLDGANAIATDKMGNVFITGYTNSTTFPTLNAGTHYQGTSTGTVDIFIVKFNNNGVRQWATYYGGDNDDRAEAITTDPAGNVYVTGSSSSSNFPTQILAGAYNKNTNTGAVGIADICIIKFSNTGTRLWATYYGSTTYDRAFDIISDAAGNIYVTGFAGRINFPLQTLAGAYNQAAFGGGSSNVAGDAFILKFNNSGACVWSTFLGGNSGDSGQSLALDAAGNLFITGPTYSTNFPLMNGGGSSFYQSTMNGGGMLGSWISVGDLFITKFNNSGAMVWSTYLGGSEMDGSEDMVIDSKGDVFVVGASASSLDFPLLNPGSGAYFQSTYGGGTLRGDVALLKFTNSGTLLWSTFYGGTGADIARGICIDPCDNFYVTGFVGGAGFPTYNPGWGYFQGGFGGNMDAFVAGFNDNCVWQWGTTFGGFGYECGENLALDLKGNLFVTGKMSSGATANPGSGAYFQAGSAGSDDALIAKFTPRPMLFNNTVTPTKCIGSAGGTATINVVGGIAPYLYTWSNGQSAQTATNLSSGIYTATVSDQNCSIDTTSFIITAPLPLLAFVPAQTNLSCNGAKTGSATAAALGGTGAYTYNWQTSPVQQNVTATALSVGTWSVIITDANGCTAVKAINITEPPLLTVTAPQISGILCKGGNNGMASANVTGGVAGYNYSWQTNPPQSNSIATGLTAGTFSVVVTDANNCTSIATVNITEPSELVPNSITTDATCGVANGVAGVVPSGGSSPYSYLWNNGNTAASLMGITAGNYSLTISDRNGCSVNATITVSNTGLPAIAVTTTSVNCFGNNTGSIATMVSSGTSPYSYSWSNSLNTSTVSSLAAGIYSLTVTDVNGCVSTTTITVTEPAIITSTINTQSVLCNGGSSGSATIIISGGTIPYSYSWSNGNNSNSINNVIASNYNITITDGNGCTHQSAVQVTEPSLIRVDVAGASVCSGATTQLSSAVTGGMPGYNYFWSSGQNSPVANGIAGGLYTLTVVDANGCSGIGTASISTLPLPDVSFVADNESGCGPLCVNFTNTTSAINAVWDLGNGNSSFTNNPTNCYTETGSYNVSLTITDNNGCSNTLTKNNFITVHPDPAAHFIFNPHAATILDPTLHFTDQSVGAAFWNWSFGDIANSSASVQHPSFTYPSDTGSYQVTLSVINEFGCRASYSDIITIKTDYIFYIPNTFTPNADGLNDIFSPVVTGIDGTEYDLYIFDRWGDIIFHSDSPIVGWDGRANVGNATAQQDVYVWKILTNDVNGKRHNYTGHVSLVR